MQKATLAGRGRVPAKNRRTSQEQNKHGQNKRLSRSGGIGQYQTQVLNKSLSFKNSSLYVGGWDTIPEFDKNAMAADFPIL